MEYIEKISYDGTGCQPILIKEGWQVFKINYSKNFDIETCSSLYLNRNFGLAITLLVGDAFLITENKSSPPFTLKMEKMNSGSSYYIPENLGYTIIMKKETELFSVENPKEDPLKFEKRSLTSMELDVIRKGINKEFKRKR